MSGSDMNNREVAQGVFHALHPRCPAFPGEPNQCAHQCCDCGQCDDLPGQVRSLRKRVESLTAQLAAERERCAKVCLKVADECHNDDGFRSADVCAAAIRALPAPEAT